VASSIVSSSMTVITDGIGLAATMPDARGAWEV
jgi:hypothetical protein